MSNSFNSKLLEGAHRHKDVIYRSHKPHPHVPIKGMDKKTTYNMKQSQILTSIKQHATSHIKATGQYSNILSGGPIDIPIRSGSGFGHVNNEIIKFNIQNTSGSDSELISDASLWIDYIEYLSPEDAVVQKIYGKEDLYEKTDVYNSKEWKVKSKLRGADKNWRKKNFILASGESKVIYIDLLSCFLKTCGIFLPALEGESIMRIHFRPSSDTLISGSVPTMTSLELLIDTAYMSNVDFRDEMKNYKENVLDFRYPFTVTHPFSQSMAPDTTYDFVLNGFNGLFTELRFVVQPSVRTGNNLKTYYRIKEFEILDESGTNVIGGSYKTHEETQYIDYSHHYDNDQNLHLNIYRYSFSADPAAMVTRGQVAGMLPLGGRDQLRIKTGPAEVNKVVTLTRATGTAASAGNYRLCYKGYYTSVLAYNAATSAIELAIEALPPFKDNNINVTVSAAISSDPITVSWGGQLAEEEPEELIYVDSLDINNGSIDLFYNSTLTTDYVPGFPSGSANYVVVVSGVKVQRLRLNQGNIEVYST